MENKLKGWPRFILAAAALLAPCSVMRAQVPEKPRLSRSTQEYINSLEDPDRAAWQKPQEVAMKLELKPGEAVADLGAGSGYFTVLFARAVGPAGEVFAVDVDPEMLEYVAYRAKEEHLDNIRTVLALPHDPKLAAGSVDMVFICNTLHHISDRDKYYPLLARALKPNGRLVNIDFVKRPIPVPGPPLRMRSAKEDVAKEVKPSGFRLVKSFDFLPYQYFLVFERSKH